MKPGDLLYTIYEDNWTGKKAKLSVKAAKVVSVGPKRVTITGADGDRPGLPFGCRTQLSRDEAARYGRTPKEAWLQYYEQIEKQIDRTERELVELRRLYHLAADEVRK